MRKIKFRGLELMTGDWVYGNHLKTGTGLEFIVPQNLIANQLPQYAIDKVTVGQYTGLKDKKGVEIFESDVVKFSFKDGESVNTRVMEVFNDGLAFGLREIYRDYWLENVDGILVLKHGHLNKYHGDIQRMLKPLSGIYFYEVIGNIHDNPEILEKSS